MSSSRQDTDTDDITSSGKKKKHRTKDRENEKVSLLNT